MKKAGLILSLKLFTILSFGQNLVTNPSFEEYSACPVGFSQLPLATPWESPATGFFSSTEFYHGCQGDGFGESCVTCVPINTFGEQYAFTGEGYCGFWAYFPLSGGSTVNEAAQVILTEPLIEGVEYEVSFWVSLAENSLKAIDQISAHFSNTAVTTGVDIYLEPHVSSPEGVYLTEKEGWTQISGTYIANGGEQYITVGNFESFYTTSFVQTPGGIWDGAYYYLDEVSVIGPEVEPQVEILGQNSICQGDSTTLTGINTDQWTWWTIFDDDLIISIDSSITVSPELTTIYFLNDGEETITHLLEVCPFHPLIWVKIRYCVRVIPWNFRRIQIF